MSQKQHSIFHYILPAYFIFYFWIWFTIVSVVTLLFRLLQIRRIKTVISKRKKKGISVLYLEVFSPQGAGNRYRAGKWTEVLNKNGFRSKVKHVVEYDEYIRLTSSQESVVFFHIEFLWKRLLQCLQSVKYDIVIVRRELLMFNDYGNLFFERLMFWIHPHLLLDFDDDIAAAKREPRTISKYGKLLLEHPTKFSASLKFYSGFIPGTEYLKQLVLQKQSDVTEEQILVVPTCVDYDNFSIKDYSISQEELVIGWVGARNNLKNVLQIIPALNMLVTKYKIRLLIICDQPLIIPSLFPIQNIPWSEKREVENIRMIDIGIMPLDNNNAEEKGKAGFKLIQYMGCGIVSIATALTVNKEIVDDGVNGFLVEPDTDWTPVFEKVFSQREEFPSIGKRAFEKISSYYSFNANKETYIKFLNQQIDRK